MGAQAAAEKIRLSIECKEIKEKAETKAEKITLIANANYLKKVKENQAAAKMSKKQFDLLSAEYGIKAMENIGRAKWRMPSNVMQFYESFSPYLRMGPITAQELMGEMGIQGGR